MNFRTLFFIVSLVLIFSGCRGKIYTYGESFAELMKNDDGLFRGVNIGDSPEEIQQSEGSGPAESSDDLITYNGPIGDLGTYTIRYGFENGRLFEILVDATFDERQEGQKMLLGFRDYFNDTFGPFQKESGFLVWRTKPGAKNQDVRIEMVDESEFADFGNWSLSMYHQIPSKVIETTGPVL